MTMRIDPKTGEWVAAEGSPEAVSLKNIAERSRTMTRTATRVAKPKKTAEQIRRQIMEHEFYGYAVRLANHIAEQMNLDRFEGVIFCNMREECYYNGTTRKVVMGYQMVDSCAKNGQYEPYKAVKHVWRENGYTTRMYGKQAIWEIILHELAHHLTDEDGNGFKLSNKQGGYHHRFFQGRLNELIILFPWEEVKSI